MSKRGSFLESFAEQHARTVAAVGVTPRARLEWAVREVQKGRAGMTPGEVDDFCRQLAVFARDRAAVSDDAGDIRRPSAEAASGLLLEVDRMLTDTAAREPILVGRRIANIRLEWHAGRYIAVPVREGGFSWSMAARTTLARLLEELGHLVHICKAPKARKKQAECGTLFVASRPGQEFCSPRCQARAATRRFRDKTSKKKRSLRSQGGR